MPKKQLIPIRQRGMPENVKFRFVQFTLVGGKKRWGIAWASCSDAVTETNFSHNTAHSPPEQVSQAQFGTPAQFGTLPVISGRWHSYGVNVVSTPATPTEPIFIEFNQPCGG